MTKQLQVNCSISIAFYRQNRTAHPIRWADKVTEVLEGEKELARKIFELTTENSNKIWNGRRRSKKIYFTTK